MPGRPGKRIVGIKDRVSLETQFRWIKSGGKRSPSKTNWASCAIAQGSQGAFKVKRDAHGAAIALGAGSGGGFRGDPIAGIAGWTMVGAGIVTYASFLITGAFAGATVTGYSIEGGIVLQHLARHPIAELAKLGILAFQSKNTSTPTFTDFNKPCSENKGNFG